MSTSDDKLTAAVFHRFEATKRIHGNKRCGSSRVSSYGRSSWLARDTGYVVPVVTLVENRRNRLRTFAFSKPGR